MKSIISKAVILTGIAATLLSFSAKFGGEGFTISLNNKVVIEKYNKEISTVNNLLLDAASPNDLLSVKYYHCGRVGKSRTISIKDNQNKILREWHFNDAATEASAMSFNVKDIVSLKKKNENSFRLFYASAELPNGRQLANIIIGNNAMAARK